MWATYFAMVAMVREVADPDICLFGATTILLLCRIITPQEAFAGERGSRQTASVGMHVLRTG